jgi:hypothetical protein
MSTEYQGSQLALRHTRHPISPRLEYRRRLVAFMELFADAVRKPAAIYALSRKEPRCRLPDDKQREIIHDGIRDGLISRARIIRYRAAQLLDDFAQFPEESGPKDLLFVEAMLQTAECVEALTVAHGLPTEANRIAAVRESREAIATTELHCHVLLALPTHPLPMGASR